MELLPIFHQIFENTVKKHPQSAAVVFNDISITYSELNIRANRIAHYINSLNINNTSDPLIGLYAERSIEMIVGIIGILKAGFAYVPLDPNYPNERINYIIDNSNISTLLTTETLFSKLPDNSIKTIFFEEVELEKNNPKYEKNLSLSITNKHNAYVIYTSGSTGKPKGVLINHYNVTRLFSSTNNLFQFNNKDIWALFHTFTFDSSVLEIWGALFFGGKLVIIPFDITRSPDDFYC